MNLKNSISARLDPETLRGKLHQEYLNQVNTHFSKVIIDPHLTIPLYTNINTNLLDVLLRNLTNTKPKP